MLRSRAACASYVLLIVSMTPVQAPQDKPKKGDSENKTLFLVARPELRDPIFKESVVLMFPPAVGPEGRSGRWSYRQQTRPRCAE